jgi:NADH-quinone oxidoreductase subunit J
MTHSIFQMACFIAFAVVAVGAALAVVSVKNTVHSVLSLVLTFFSVACLWILAQAEFLGLALVVVYVGAVMVLFLFVVMMLDIDIVKIREGWVRYLPVGLLVAVVMLVEILALIGFKAKLAAPYAANAASAAADVSNTRWLAHTLFTKFLLPFEFAAVILTVAVIAAVMLTLRKRPGTKTQKPAEQARVKASDRLRMVDVAVENPVRETLIVPTAAEPEAKP